MTILPMRNLPGEAEPWGREVDNRVSGLGSNLERVKSAVGNQLRTVGGQLAVASEQVDELYIRTSQRISVSDITVTAPASGLPSPVGTGTLSFPASPDTRPARIEVYGGYQNLPNTSQFTFLTYNGQIIAKDRSMNFLDAILIAYILVPANTPPQFTLSYQAISFSGSSTSTLSEITAYLTWGAPVT